MPTAHICTLRHSERIRSIGKKTEIQVKLGSTDLPMFCSAVLYLETIKTTFCLQTFMKFL